MTKIAWAARAKIVRSEISTRKQFLSEGGLYRIDIVSYNHPSLVDKVQLFGPMNGSPLMLLSEHRKRGPAEAAADLHSRVAVAIKSPVATTKRR